MMEQYLVIPYDDAQRKQFVNAEHIHKIYLDRLRKYAISYRFNMLWQKQANGSEVLVKQHVRTKKREYLGSRSEETERIESEFNRSKEEMKEHIISLKDKLDHESRLNRVFKISRVPNAVVDLFAKINELDMDEKLVAIGTNSLFAYEAFCGVFLEDKALSTYDIDLLNRRDKSLSLVYRDVMPSNSGLDFLRSIDKSFYQDEKVPYQFKNKNDVIVELINPISHSVRIDNLKHDPFEDVVKLGMEGMQWLENSRLFSSMVVGENGRMAKITTIHPLEFAIYKNWLGKKEDRNRQKHDRDIGQSRLVTRLIREYMPQIDIEADAMKLRHLKREVIDDYLEAIGQSQTEAPGVKTKRQRRR